MNLKQIVIQKVSELGGPEKATEFFGKSKQAINLWLKNGAIPMDAVQKVLDSQEVPSEAPEQEPDLSQYPPLEPSGVNSDLLFSRVDQLETKISNIEYFLQHGQMPPAPSVPGYGFRPSPVSNSVIPPGIPLQASQINTAIQPQQAQPVVGGNAPVTQGPGPYMPTGNAWCQPHRTPPATR